MAPATQNKNQNQRRKICVSNSMQDITQPQHEKKSKNERKSHNPTIFYALCVSGFIVELCSMQS